MSGLKKGDTCFCAYWEGSSLKFWTYHLRTIQARKDPILSWAKPLKYGYWWQKVPGLTWGKLSKKHGDFGWLKNADRLFCRKHLIERGRPYAATKLGAVRAEIADLRGYIKEYGADEDLEGDGVTLGRQLQLALTAQKRLRKARG